MKKAADDDNFIETDDYPLPTIPWKCELFPDRVVIWNNLTFLTIHHEPEESES